MEDAEPETISQEPQVKNQVAKSLFVRGLGRETTANDLTKAFEQFSLLI